MCGKTSIPLQFPRLPMITSVAMVALHGLRLIGRTMTRYTNRCPGPYHFKKAMFRAVHAHFSQPRHSTQKVHKKHFRLFFSCALMFLLHRFTSLPVLVYIFVFILPAADYPFARTIPTTIPLERTLPAKRLLADDPVAAIPTKLLVGCPLAFA